MTASTPIRSAAVLGAGTMGAQIAAHLANAGVPVAAARPDGRRRARRPEARRARSSRTRSSRRTPPRSITTGGFDTTSAQLADVDWIIEAVVERLDVKRGAARARRCRAAAGHDRHRRTRPAFRSRALAEGRSDDFRRHWLGTHFFNPPRYLQLLELIPTADTDPAVVDRMSLVRRSPARQGRRRREGHAELHRQPHRPLRRHRRCCGRSNRGELHDRGDRRDHRPGDRPAEERDVPDDGHRRHRRPRPRRAQPARAAARTTSARRVRAAAARRTS